MFAEQNVICSTIGVRGNLRNSRIVCYQYGWDDSLLDTVIIH
jgi:hypothetical protein